jgi:REP element-mobilizing transposase RayT
MSKQRVKRGQVEMTFRTHGGKRRGAGRKPKHQRPGARHAARPEHDPRHPVHVTIRVVGSASGLRRKDLYLAFREATIVTAKREDFRIVHMSIQRDHVHLLVEAERKASLSNGVRGFSISAARQINRAITARGGERRTGRVIGDRFHARPLTSPRAVRNAIAYCLGNWRTTGRIARPSRAPGRSTPSRAARCSSAGRSWSARRSCGRCRRRTTRSSCFALGRGCSRRAGRRITR